MAFLPLNWDAFLPPNNIIWGIVNKFWSNLVVLEKKVFISEFKEQIIVKWVSVGEYAKQKYYII